MDDGYTGWDYWFMGLANALQGSGPEKPQVVLYGEPHGPYPMAPVKPIVSDEP